MKFTLSWLKEHLDTHASLDDIVEGLTRIGLEVEGVEDPRTVLAPYKVVSVISAKAEVEGRKVALGTALDSGLTLLPFDDEQFEPHNLVSLSFYGIGYEEMHEHLLTAYNHLAATTTWWLHATDGRSGDTIALRE